MKTEFATLYTPFENNLNCDKPWDVYPRPQLKRESFINLNGKWNLEIIRKGVSSFNGEIIVPFPLESRLSGVSFKKQADDILVYTKAIMLTPTEKNIILNFGAVDQECKVYVNDNFVGENVGGYLPFSFDITDVLQERNELIVKAVDTSPAIAVVFPSEITYFGIVGVRMWKLKAVRILTIKTRV